MSGCQISRTKMIHQILSDRKMTVKLKRFTTLIFISIIWKYNLVWEICEIAQGHRVTHFMCKLLSYKLQQVQHHSAVESFGIFHS